MLRLRGADRKKRRSMLASKEKRELPSESTRFAASASLGSLLLLLIHTRDHLLSHRQVYQHTTINTPPHQSLDYHFKNSLGIRLHVRFDSENEVYYKRTVSIEGVCMPSIDRRQSPERDTCARENDSTPYGKWNPIDVKKTGQQRLPKHLNIDLPRQPDRGDEKMHSIAACSHSTPLHLACNCSPTHLVKTELH